MKKALFIDRDGTLIVEPPDDFQVDSLEKLEFIPKVFRNLYNITSNLNYELIIVSNQDGLGTDAFPEELYWPVQHKMLKAFLNEGILFSDVLVDSSFPHENAPTRKPGIGMFSKYLSGDYDLSKSYVIGDRITDVELAKNLGAKAIFFNSPEQTGALKAAGLDETCILITQDWDEIYRIVAAPVRTARINRKTKETDITIELNIDGSGKSDISTGLGFFNHMLEQIARHSGCDLSVQVKGDLNVDEHHTIEDTALVLGEAFRQTLGDKAGIERYGFCLPMDDCLAQVAIDFGGRPWLVWDAHFTREKIGDVPTEMFFHFFRSFSDAALCNLNIKSEGSNEHHKIEAIFKAVAKSIKMAVRKDPYNFSLPSTKGTL